MRRFHDSEPEGEDPYFVYTLCGTCDPTEYELVKTFGGNVAGYLRDVETQRIGWDGKPAHLRNTGRQRTRIRKIFKLRGIPQNQLDEIEKPLLQKQKELQ